MLAYYVTTSYKISLPPTKNEEKKTKLNWIRNGLQNTPRWVNIKFCCTSESNDLKRAADKDITGFYEI